MFVKKDDERRINIPYNESLLMLIKVNYACGDK